VGPNKSKHVPMFDPDPFHPNVFLESRGFLIWFPQIYQTFIRMIHMPEVLTIMFSAGNFGRAYDESLADFFWVAWGTSLLDTWFTWSFSGCAFYRRTGEAHPPHRSFGGCLNSFRWVSRKMDGTDCRFVRNENDGSSLCLLRRDFLSSFVLVHFGHGSFDVRT
jgi:hypothetical protein